MAYLAVAAGGESADVNSATAWAKVGASYSDARSSEAHGGSQVARVFVWFSVAAETAVIAFALVGKNTGTVYAYREGYAVAGARRSVSTGGASGNYVGRITFTSTTAPTAYANDGVDKIDLMHGLPEDFNGNEEVEWRFGVVTDAATGTVYVSVTTSTVI